MRKYLSFLLTLALPLFAGIFQIQAVTIVPTPVGRTNDVLGAGVIVARSFPGILPIGKTLIRGWNSAGYQESILTHQRNISWFWYDGTITISYGFQRVSFPITSPHPDWKFVMTVSGGGPEPISTTTSVEGCLFPISSPCSVFIPEILANGSVLLPENSTRHVLWRFEKNWLSLP